jgi:glycosyltransferase involved in cell wall biosynthesis
MNKFSIIIPTYKAVDYLDICLKSLSNVYQKESFEVIVICDGYFSLHEQTIEKYSQDIDLKVIKFDTNRGIATAINYGVYSSQYETILIMNDDNVVPNNLVSYIQSIGKCLVGNFCVSFPQIEPRPSIFKTTVCYNFGTTPDTFNWNKFNVNVFDMSFDSHLGTFPFVMNKDLFLTVGGFSDEFGSKVGFVADWDFFTKVSNIVDIQICNNCYFYHFSQVSSSDPLARQSEQNAHEFFKFKWGQYGQINAEQTTYLKK